MRAESPSQTAAQEQPRRVSRRGKAATSALGAPLAAQPAAGLPPTALMTLQGSIGNAAVSQLVSESRHQRGQGGGYDGQTSAAPVQRAAAHHGADFSDVRLRTDPDVTASAAETSARAYSSGDHVVTGDDGTGRNALPRELTHVIQQRQVLREGVGGSGLSGRIEADRTSSPTRPAHVVGPLRGPDRTVVVQRALHPKEHNDKVGLHRYVREAEKEGGRNKDAQAPDGLYQHIGDNKFVQANENGIPISNEYYYFAQSSGTLHAWIPRNAPDSSKKEAWTSKGSVGGAGGALGRASLDEFPMGWQPRRPEDAALAGELATALGIPHELSSASAQGWHLVPTLNESPLEIFIQAPSEKQAEDWRSRNLDTLFEERVPDKVWEELKEIYPREKLSDIHAPASWPTPRSTRPTNSDFDKQSATKSITGKENKDPSRIGNQLEWCHLIGDADGGTNKKENLAAGTEAANTEQLILEQAQRKYRNFCAENQLIIEIQGRVLQPNLPTAEKYPEMENFPHHEEWAAWIRYTIWVYRSQTSRDAPVIDHIFDANRTEISKNIVRVMTEQAHQLIDAKIVSLNLTPPARKSSTLDVVMEHLNPGGDSEDVEMQDV
ncbi:eCIS core domain-containing protein [Streptomyces sp. NBC_00525]|uniref:eCIS core domain-containing protein n=1 Tax=Streptomyces sp. NBC_00525 TaxID=2903660 RepID=UPI002E81ABD9|nr:DUF4157 domain-containing protein [Streptomyces sp. NBC_00525]WUC92197.1 DUF4157 domain-containing protein [Streptomyces sp. NBC_00525]